MFARKAIIFVSLFLLIFLSVDKAFAQTVTESQGILSVSPAPAPVDYTLPYPGLLPDHPLYFLKLMRDRVVTFLISSPLKKAEFNLLQSNKRVEAAYLLVQQENKVTLAETTFSKGENYFDEAITSASEAKRQGINITEFVHTLTVANAKHLEMAQLLTSKASKKDKQTFVNLQERISKLGKKVMTLSPHK
jgi:hypothetical protein